MHNFGTCKENVAAQCQLLKLALPLPLLYHVKKRVSPKIIIFGETRFLIGSRHCTAAFSLQVLKLYTDLDPTLLHILILRKYSKFVWKNEMLALGVCLEQHCSSAGPRFDDSRSRLQNYRRIFSFPQPKTRWNALSTGFHWESAFVPEIPNPTLRLRIKKWNWNLNWPNSSFKPLRIHTLLFGGFISIHVSKCGSQGSFV